MTVIVKSYWSHQINFGLAVFSQGSKEDICHDLPWPKLSMKRAIRQHRAALQLGWIPTIFLAFTLQTNWHVALLTSSPVHSSSKGWRNGEKRGNPSVWSQDWQQPLPAGRKSGNVQYVITHFAIHRVFHEKEYFGLPFQENLKIDVNPYHMLHRLAQCILSNGHLVNENSCFTLFFMCCCITPSAAPLQSCPACDISRASFLMVTKVEHTYVVYAKMTACSLNGKLIDKVEM